MHSTMFSCHRRYLATRMAVRSKFEHGILQKFTAPYLRTFHRMVHSKRTVLKRYGTNINQSSKRIVLERYGTLVKKLSRFILEVFVFRFLGKIGEENK